jgi:hypothetical protein
MQKRLLRKAAFGILVPIFLVFLPGCNRASEDVLGTAYVAPATISLRRDLNQRNSTGVTLRHGEQVSIIDVRRRFVKVRTERGQQGWIDSAQLLSREQMDQLRRDAEHARSLPSEGAATVYEALNVHIEPNRLSPAFTKIPEGGSVGVLAHRIAPKVAEAPKPVNLVTERPLPNRRPRKERQPKSASRLPSHPPLPKAPANWQELSAERIDGAESIAEQKADREREAAERKSTEKQRPVVMEDWTLVRTKDGQCGWVLSRNLIMSIPDEVAQYAEGKRITSYFDLGLVKDEEKGDKHNWLWTTSGRIQPFDFDAWRVFLWNRRRHRYETSYRQRDVEGYFPVSVDPEDGSVFGRTFHLVTRDEDGKMRRRTYVFDTVRVHLTNTELYEPNESAHGKAGRLETGKLEDKLNQDSWIRRQFRSWTQKVFRKS